MGGGERKKQNLEVDLARKNGGFGMNIKTLDNGKTVVSVSHFIAPSSCIIFVRFTLLSPFSSSSKLVQPNGSAESLGIQVNDEISHVDGEPIDGLKHEDVIGKIKGKAVAKLKIIRYISLAVPASPSLPNANENDQPEGMGCRVCGAAASFNCSSCGPHITYCSVDCQKADWPNHKADCQSFKHKQGEDGDSSTIPATGACRVCRSKNARFRCVCGTSMVSNFNNKKQLQANNPFILDISNSTAAKNASFLIGPTIRTIAHPRNQMERPCSIPQSCPFSLVKIEFSLLLLWIKY